MLGIIYPIVTLSKNVFVTLLYFQTQFHFLKIKDIKWLCVRLKNSVHKAPYALDGFQRKPKMFLDQGQGEERKGWGEREQKEDGLRNIAMSNFPG